jgi:hypothetical protein
MKQTCLLLLLLLTSSFLNACTGTVGDSKATLANRNEFDTAEFIGYVTKIENQKALVVSSIKEEINQTKKEYYDAEWVSNIPSDIKVGQNIHVWFEGALAASYPGQGKASKVTISKIQKPVKAFLTQEEVIRKALLNKDISSINVLVIKEVKYDEKLAVWTIRYKDGFIIDVSLEEHSIEIPDK